jgi:hypothetical protein
MCTEFLRPSGPNREERREWARALLAVCSRSFEATAAHGLRGRAQLLGSERSEDHDHRFAYAYAHDPGRGPWPDATHQFWWFLRDPGWPNDEISLARRAAAGAPGAVHAAWSMLL